MSMGMGLHGVRNWLREQFGWKENQCGVQYQCIPPAIGEQYYIALDDAGVETGPEETDALTEILNLEIGVWRRPGGKPADRLGLLKLPTDLYLNNIYSNTQLERMVIVATGPVKQSGGLHMNWRLPLFINELFKLPNDDEGAGFLGALTFRGYSRFESIGIPGQGNDAVAYYGRRLRFRGLKRIQNVRATIG